jgi:hypothetical protein
MSTSEILPTFARSTINPRPRALTFHVRLRRSTAPSQSDRTIILSLELQGQRVVIKIAIEFNRLIGSIAIFAANSSRAARGK